MVKLFKLHKFFGLSAGLVLLLLGMTGFFLDHKQWSFLYTTTFNTCTESMLEADKILYDAYWIDSRDEKHAIVGGKRGIFETFDGGDTFNEMTSVQCSGIRSDDNGMYAATSDGVYHLKESSWKPYALNGSYISAISISEKKIIAVVDKHELIEIQRDNGAILGNHIVEVEPNKLKDDIKLSRFVRDLHYGRGLFDGDMSLLINDYGAIVISLLAFSGYIIWWLIRKKNSPNISRKLIKLHANSFAIIALIPLLILAITGVFLDHSRVLAGFMKSVTIPNVILPPVYSSLKHDIWSVDYHGISYRIGNRYGVYKSEDLKDWEQESRGLAFRMFRIKDTLYVSGMGAPNRKYDGSWSILRGSPHMFRDVIDLDGYVKYFSTHKTTLKLPTFTNATFYSLMMTMHDGTFFATWWIWINDYASIALLMLGLTGTIRWYYRGKKHKKRTL